MARAKTPNTRPSTLTPAALDTLFGGFFQRLGPNHEDFGIRLRDTLGQACAPARSADLERWQRSVASLPSAENVAWDLSCDAVTATGLEGASGLQDALMTFHPWRKGPFSLHGIAIDTEWRSDLKWRRLQGKISPLKGRRVVDIGCGNGYYLWRMLGEGASWVTGIDPMLLFWQQFEAVKKLLGPNAQTAPVDMLPVGIDEWPKDGPRFDTVFSMGVLYHRRSPIDHLRRCRELLRPGGEVVLETLVYEPGILDGSGKLAGAQDVLVPKDRYAQMRNVWFLPSVAALRLWLERCGFKDVQVLDTTVTTSQEQRQTPWMHFDSLTHFLDPNDPSKTIEGYPGPVRAVLRGTAP